MYSDRDEDKVLKTLEEFEIFRASVQKLFEINNAQKLAPVTIYHFASQNDFRKFTRNASVGGFYTYRDRGPIIVMGSPRGYTKSAANSVLYHEYIHYLVRARGGVRFPTWYDEGIAEVFSTMQIKGNRVILGAIPEGRANTISSVRMMGIEKLFSIRSTNRGRLTTAKIYASGWLAAHFFAFGSNNGFDNYQAQLANMFKQINAGVPVDEAYNRFFDISYDALGEQINRYAKLRNYQVVAMLAPNINKDIHAQAMSENAAITEIAYLAQQMGQVDLTQNLLDDLKGASTEMSVALANYNRAKQQEATQSTFDTISTAFLSIEDSTDYLVQNLMAQTFDVLASRIQEQLLKTEDQTQYFAIKKMYTAIKVQVMKHYERSLNMTNSYSALIAMTEYYWKNNQRQKAIDTAVSVYNLASFTTSANMFVGEYMVKIQNAELAEYFLGNAINWSHSDETIARATALLAQLPAVK